MAQAKLKDENSSTVLKSVFEYVTDSNYRNSSVGDSDFFDNSNFPWIKEIEDNWMDIRRELEVIEQDMSKVPNFQEISERQTLLTNDNKWKTFFLYGYGHRIERNCARCPKTEALLLKIPGMKTAMFSIFAPQKKIGAHTGPYNGVLRYHLGLRIPERHERCGITVGAETRHWEEGRSLVFDDTKQHEAWNLTDEYRVVLFVDFLRPLPLIPDLANRWFFQVLRRSEFVRSAVRNLTNAVDDAAVPE